MGLKQSMEEESAIRLRDFYLGPASIYGPVLFCLFGFLDYFFYPEKYTTLLFLRFVAISGILLLNLVIRKYDIIDYGKLQWSIGAVTLLTGGSLFMMTWLINDVTAVYWVGLIMLVSLLGLVGHMTFKFCLALIVCTVLPFTIYSFFKLSLSLDLRHLLGPFFLNGTAVLAIAGRWHFSSLERKEYYLRNQLANEVENRDVIIESKTAEAIRLRSFSKQFSPQIVEGIENGTISLSGSITRKEICAIFIDIKDSTKKVASLNTDNLEAVLSMYLKDVVEVMLSKNMTVDKFLGDGVFGFTNSPIEQEDFIERALEVVLAIQDLFHQKRDTYQKLWGDPFEYRIGVAVGVASIGFYGDDKYMRSYTAIGKVINLASRLNGAAETNEVVVSGEVVKRMKDRNSGLSRRLDFMRKPDQTLKGFESSPIEIWHLKPKL